MSVTDKSKELVTGIALSEGVSMKGLTLWKVEGDASEALDDALWKLNRGAMTEADFLKMDSSRFYVKDGLVSEKVSGFVYSYFGRKDNSKDSLHMTIEPFGNVPGVFKVTEHANWDYSSAQVNPYETLWGSSHSVGYYAIDAIKLAELQNIKSSEVIEQGHLDGKGDFSVEMSKARPELLKDKLFVVEAYNEQEHMAKVRLNYIEDGKVGQGLCADIKLPEQNGKAVLGRMCHVYCNDRAQQEAVKDTVLSLPEGKGRLPEGHAADHGTVKRVLNEYDLYREAQAVYRESNHALDQVRKAREARDAKYFGLGRVVSRVFYNKEFTELEKKYGAALTGAYNAFGKLEEIEGLFTNKDVEKGYLMVDNRIKALGRADKIQRIRDKEPFTFNRHTGNKRTGLADYKMRNHESGKEIGGRK